MSTENDTLATDNGQEPGHDLDMGIYLAEWLEAKGMEGADLARRIGCSRSLVSKWVTKERPLKDINWITKICAVLEISQEQLSKMPPKLPGKVIVSSGVLSDSPPTAAPAASPEGIEMFDERVVCIQILGELPDELIPAARKMLERLRDIGGGAKSAHPTKRGSTKS